MIDGVNRIRPVDEIEVVPFDDGCRGGDTLRSITPLFAARVGIESDEFAIAASNIDESFMELNPGTNTANSLAPHNVASIEVEAKKITPAGACPNEFTLCRYRGSTTFPPRAVGQALENAMPLSTQAPLGWVGRFAVGRRSGGFGHPDRVIRSLRLEASVAARAKGVGID